MPAPAPQPRSSAVPTLRHTSAARHASATRQQPAASSELLPGAGDPQVIAEVRRALAGLRYGSVTLIVQDGRVIQIESTSRVRFASQDGAAGRGR